MNRKDLPELVGGYFDYLEYEGQLRNSNSIDLSGSNWIDSVTAFLLANLKFSRNIEITAGSQSNAMGYFNTIANRNPEWWKSRSYGILYSPSDSYLPFSRLPKSQRDFATLTNAFMARMNSFTIVGGKNTFMSVLGELTDNIYQHSNFTSAFMMCQVYRTKRYVDISFIDDGITIPGNFEANSIAFDSDGQAIDMAVNGTSTKDPVVRGRGLGDSLRIYCEGADAKAMIVSREGIYYRSSADVSLFNLKSLSKFRGTLICIRSPIMTNEIPLYDYFG
jgi:hypothetical protein